jgi:flagellar biosynthetic protein FliO
MIKKLSLLCISIFICSILNAQESKDKASLVDVNKDSSLSSYFQKVSGKLSDNSEQETLLNDESGVELDESKIMLNTSSQPAKNENDISPVNKMILSIFALLMVAGAFFTLIKKIGQKQGHQAIASNIKVLTQKSIGPKKQLMLIRVAGETILLGVTDQNINPIKTLSLMDDELPEFTEPKFSGQLKAKIQETKMTDEEEPVDGFSISRLDQVKNEVNKRYLSE